VSRRGDGGNDCRTQVFVVPGFGSSSMNRVSYPKWDTDDWRHEPPFAVERAETDVEIESDGGLWRGCHNESVHTYGWDYEPSLISLQVTWPWGRARLQRARPPTPMWRRAPGTPSWGQWEILAR